MKNYCKIKYLYWAMYWLTNKICISTTDDNYNNYKLAPALVCTDSKLG
jgi:hypothetical protein